MPADVLHSTMTASGVSADRHRLFRAHGALLTRRRGAKGGLTKLCDAVLTLLRVHRNMTPSGSIDSFPPSGWERASSGTLSIPAYQVSKALARLTELNSVLQNSPSLQRPGLFCYGQGTPPDSASQCIIAARAPLSSQEARPLEYRRTRQPVRRSLLESV